MKILEAKQERDGSPRCRLLATNSIIRSCCSWIIHGTNGGCNNSDHTQRRPEHKTGQSYIGRKRHFYLGLALASASLAPRLERKYPEILNRCPRRYHGPLQQTINAMIRAGDEVGYIAECLEIAVVTQGRTLDETVKHLQEATALHLAGEHLADFGLREKPTLVLTMELDPAHAQAS